MRYATNGCNADSAKRNQDAPSVQAILRLYTGLSIALAVTGRFVAAETSDGLNFEYICGNYLQDLEEGANLGSTVLESAITLSLNYLNSKLLNMSKVSSEHSMQHMYVSLCVMQKQQWVPTAVLGRMWAVIDRDAARIAGLFKSKSLAKTSIQDSIDSKNELGLRIHDLHHGFCRQEAQGECAKNWHFRLLQGHMTSLSGVPEQKGDIGYALVDILKHSSQPWYLEDLTNRKYLLQNLTRHLCAAGLIWELWALLLDP